MDASWVVSPWLWQNQAELDRSLIETPSDLVSSVGHSSISAAFTIRRHFFCLNFHFQHFHAFCVHPHHLGCQRDTARICSWAPAPAAIDRCLLPAERSAANPAHAAAMNDGREDAQPLPRSCSAYCAGSVCSFCAITAAVPPLPQDGALRFSHRTLHHSVQLVTGCNCNL